MNLAIKSIGANIDFFKALKETLVELYKLYHRSPFYWSELHQALVERGYTPDSCIEEWQELKLRVQEISSLEPTVKYLYMWQQILNKTFPSLTNIVALLRITLVIPIQTVRGFFSHEADQE